MKSRVIPECLKGEKRICLAISEPYAGSDVSNVQTTAVLSEDKTHFIVNGVKKWITSGLDSDYFVTAVKTGFDKNKPSNKQISMLMIERPQGVKTTLIKTL